MLTVTPRVAPIRVVIASVVVTAAAAAAAAAAAVVVVAAVVVAGRGVAVVVVVIEALEPLCPSLVMKYHSLSLLETLIFSLDETLSTNTHIKHLYHTLIWQQRRFGKKPICSFLSFSVHANSCNLTCTPYSRHGGATSLL